MSSARSQPQKGADPVLNLSLAEKMRSLRQREISARDLCQSYLNQIERTQPGIAAYLRTLGDTALQAAARADQELDAAAKGQGSNARPLLGLPYALKDNMVTQGVVTSAGSKMLQAWVPPYDGAHHEALHKAGGILLGKQAMDEFAMGSSNENTPFDPPKNPWDLARVPGGSSGGGAASVAGRGCAFALGSDTGGSIRQPAAFCGVVGLKPSYGRVSRRGLIAYASSLDQVGPMTLTVRDAALVLSCLAGPDPMDATSAKQPVPDFVTACEAGIAGKRIGVSRSSLELPGFDPRLKAHFLENLSQLAKLGAQIVDIELPAIEHAVAAYYIIASAEASSNLARFDGVRYGHRASGGDLMDQYCQSRSQGFGPEVIRRILLGTFVLRADSYEAYYGQALRARTLISQQYQKAFASCDVIASPVSPVLPFLSGEKQNDPLAMYLADIFTVSINLAKLPAMSVPAGFIQEQAKPLPVGLQLIGPYMDEAAMLSVASAYEDAHPHWQTLPPHALENAS